MKTSIALVSAALLLGAALARPRAVDRTPPRRPPPAVEPVAAAPPEDAFDDARRAFNTGMYARAEALLARGSGDPRARALLEELPRARRDRLERLKYKRYPLRLDADTLDELSHDEWNELAPYLVEAAAAPPDVEYGTLAAVQRALDTQKIDLAFERVVGEDVIACIRDYTGLSILMDAEVVEPLRPDALVSIHAKDITPREALRAVLSQTTPSKRIVVTEDRRVLLTDSFVEVHREELSLLAEELRVNEMTASFR